MAFAESSTAAPPEADRAPIIAQLAREASIAINVHDVMIDLLQETASIIQGAGSPEHY
jgi:hypothetical protein